MLVAAGLDFPSFGAADFASIGLVPADFSGADARAAATFFDPVPLLTGLADAPPNFVGVAALPRDAGLAALGEAVLFAVATPLVTGFACARVGAAPLAAAFFAVISRFAPVATGFDWPEALTVETARKTARRPAWEELRAAPVDPSLVLFSPGLRLPVAAALPPLTAAIALVSLPVRAALLPFMEGVPRADVVFGPFPAAADEATVPRDLAFCAAVFFEDPGDEAALALAFFTRKPRGEIAAAAAGEAVDLFRLGGLPAAGVPELVLFSGAFVLLTLRPPMRFEFSLLRAGEVTK